MACSYICWCVITKIVVLAIIIRIQIVATQTLYIYYYVQGVILLGLCYVRRYEFTIFFLYDIMGHFFLIKFIKTIWDSLQILQNKF